LRSVSTSKDRRFLHTPPYAWELGAVAAAATIWKLLAKTEDVKSEPEAQAGSATEAPVRSQA
jgi:hypothetical protein